MIEARLTLTRFRCAAAALVAGFALAMSGCGGDDKEQQATPVAGTFVGKVSGTKAFVAVVTSPAGKAEDRRGASVYVCDGSRLCEWFRGSATENDFVATSEDDAEAKVELSEKTATGTVELPDGESARYKASSATATAGLYDLTVSSNGRLRGASAAGVGVTGRSMLPSGAGSLKLADGTRLEFDVSGDSAEDKLRLRPGQIRLIVLPGGQVRGAGKSRRTGSGAGSSFFIRSSSK